MTRPNPSDAKQNWIDAPASITDDMLSIRGHQVMQSWEYNYMKSLAGVVTSRGGDVLEVGYGLGISARLIQRSKRVDTHTVIECHPKVVQYARSEFQQTLDNGRMKIVHGFWEDASRLFPDSSFDGILFDTYPLDGEPRIFHFFPFFREAFRLLRPRGVLSYYSDEPTEMSSDHRAALTEAGFRDIRFKLCRVRPPASCSYWQHRTIVAPIVVKD